MTKFRDLFERGPIGGHGPTPPPRPERGAKGALTDVANRFNGGTISDTHNVYFKDKGSAAPAAQHLKDSGWVPNRPIEGDLHNLTLDHPDHNDRIHLLGDLKSYMMIGYPKS